MVSVFLTFLYHSLQNKCTIAVVCMSKFGVIYWSICQRKALNRQLLIDFASRFIFGVIFLTNMILILRNNVTGDQPIVVNDFAIIDVWSNNVEEEFRRICELATTHGFRYVAMDTEFPGVVARPYGTFRSHTDYQYQVLRSSAPCLS